MISQREAKRAEAKAENKRMLAAARKAQFVYVSDHADMWYCSYCGRNPIADLTRRVALEDVLRALANHRNCVRPVNPYEKDPV